MEQENKKSVNHQAEGPSDEQMEEVYGKSHAGFEDRVAGGGTREEMITLKLEIEKDKELTEAGRFSLLNDLNTLWEV